MGVPVDQLDSEIEKILKSSKLKVDKDLEKIKKKIPHNARQNCKRERALLVNQTAGHMKALSLIKRMAIDTSSISKGKGQLTHLLELGIPSREGLVQPQPFRIFIWGSNTH